MTTKLANNIFNISLNLIILVIEFVSRSPDMLVYGLNTKVSTN